MQREEFEKYVGKKITFKWLSSNMEALVHKLEDTYFTSYDVIHYGNAWNKAEYGFVYSSVSNVQIVGDEKMKFVIPGTTIEEKRAYIKLVQDGDSLELIETDSHGTKLSQDNILEIKSDGTIFLEPDYKGSLKTDGRGRVICK